MCLSKAHPTRTITPQIGSKIAASDQISVTAHVDLWGIVLVVRCPKDYNKHENWETADASIGKHTLRVEIPPVPGE